MAAPVSGPEQPVRVAFLLGAGASTAAKIPDMRQFTEEFEKLLHAQHAGLYPTFLRIRERLKGTESDDLEGAMRSLEFIAGKSPFNEVAQAFGRAPEPKEQEEAEALLRLLQEFISHRTFVNDLSRIEYLDELVSLLGDFGAIPIFTVNYDTTLELMCERARIAYTDGFEPTWNPRLFEKTDVLRIYKLHGSCTWYSSGASYTKLPIKPVESRFELLGGGVTQTMLIYPTATKTRTSEPLAVLLGEFRRTLLGLNALFVIGYSCRDEELATVLSEAKRVNPYLVIYIVTPHPFKAAKRLHSTDPNLSDSCLLISARWEDILAEARLGRIIRSHSVGLKGFLEARNQVRYQGYYLPSGSDYAGELVKSFQHDLLRQVWRWADQKLTPGVPPGNDDHATMTSIAWSSLGLLYWAILRDDQETVQKCALSLMKWVDFKASERKEPRGARDLLARMKPPLEMEAWNSNAFYPVAQLFDYPMRSWAEWVPPFLADERFSNSLLPLSSSTGLVHEDNETLNSLRSLAYSRPEDSGYSQALSRVAKSAGATPNRFKHAPDISTLRALKTGPQQHYKAVWSALEPWIQELHGEGLSEAGKVITLLEEMAR